MNVAIIIATFGREEWQEAAWTHAHPSTLNQGAMETIVRHQARGTLAEVRNQAATSASAEWLCFLDADDRLGDGYLEAMRDPIHCATVPILNPPFKGRWPQLSPLSLLVPAVQYVRGGDCVGRPAIPNADRSLIDVNRAVIGTLVPRSLFFEVGGFRELPMYEDWDLWLRCVIAGATLVDVPEAVYCADADPGRNTNPALADATYWRIRGEHEAAFLAAG